MAHEIAPSEEVYLWMGSFFGLGSFMPFVMFRRRQLGFESEGFVLELVDGDILVIEIFSFMMRLMFLMLGIMLFSQHIVTRVHHYLNFIYQIKFNHQNSIFKT
jgi:hypothetical protein